mgnify:CR=1 FL=1
MYWQDKGYLLSKVKYNENSIIAEIFTENHGKITGLIFGASSNKKKNYLQVGNKLHVNYSSKTENKIGNFKFEIDKILTPLFLDNQKKLACILSAMSLIKILTVESQENNKIFYSIDNFFDILNKSYWLKNYILWELEFLKLIGYDLSLKNLVTKDYVDKAKIYYVKSNNQKKIIPNYLVDVSLDPKNNDELIDGLQLVTDYLNKSILKPNNINHPGMRINFINLLK